VPTGRRPRFPVRFDGLDHARIYLELSAEAPRGVSVGLYYTLFEAVLDARELALPVLKTGENRWTLADDPDGSHRARLVLRWEDRPAPERVPRFRGRPGLLAWSLTEEIGPELSRELSPYYGLVRELDPEHPPTVLHNNLEAAKVDLATNRPLVVTHDFYPFFWSPRSGPSNPRRSIAMYRSRIAAYYKACREHGASLWMMPQAWGAEETAPLDPPNYGYRQGMRTPEPGEIKLQGWVAVAEGATGLMF